MAGCIENASQSFGVTMKTVMGSKETVQRNWVVIDVKGKVLGRSATTIASILRGRACKGLAKR
jgi:hypothetical protein